MCARRWPPLLTAVLLSACKLSETDPPVYEDPCSPGSECAPGELLRGCGECISAAHLTLDLEECSAGLSATEIEADLAVSVRFVGSFADLRRAARQSSELAHDVGYLFASVTLPPSFTSPEPGRYSSTEEALDVFPYFGKDYEAGKVGDPILPALFDWESYLAGAVVTQLEGFEGKDVSYSRPGPLVELLGQGLTPPNPVHFGLGDTVREMRSQVLRSVAHVGANAGDGPRVEYDVEWTRDALVDEPFFDAATEIATTISPLRITGAPEAQSFEIAEWSVGVVTDDAAPLRGRAALTVKGSAVPHVTTVLLEGRPHQEPSVFVRCL